MHAPEILGASLPPQYSFGGPVQYKASYNQSTDSARAPLQMIHHNPRSYEAAFGPGHYDDGRLKAPKALRNPIKEAENNDFIVVVDTEPMVCDDDSNYLSTGHRWPQRRPSNTSQDGFNHYRQNLNNEYVELKQFERPAVAPYQYATPEIIVLEHNTTAVYELDEDSGFNGHEFQDSEKIPVRTISIELDSYQMLDRSRSQTPIPVVPEAVYLSSSRSGVSSRRGSDTSTRRDDTFASTEYRSTYSCADHQEHDSRPLCTDHLPPPYRAPSRPQTPGTAVILSEPVTEPPPTPGIIDLKDRKPDFYLLTHSDLTDGEAFAAVQKHFSQRSSNQLQQRASEELSRLIFASPFLTGCLGEVVHWANILFFEEKLSPAKLDMQWSSLDDTRFSHPGGLIGTTELKPDDAGGYQTRIILSRPLLQSNSFDQRLVLSAILHEMVHAYLFVVSGFEARAHGGHTPGFKGIARLIDNWVDRDGSWLRLGSTEADLDAFRTAREGHGWDECGGCWGRENGFLWSLSGL